MSSSSHSDVYDCAIYVPRINRSLLDELASHLSKCCGKEAGSAVHEAAPRLIDVTPVRGVDEVVPGAPATGDLAAALETVERAAVLMAEFQSLGRLVEDYEEIERRHHLLEDRLAQYECGFGLVAEQLREARDEAEEYQRRCATAEEKLDVLMGAVLKMFRGALPGSVSALEHKSPVAT